MALLDSGSSSTFSGSSTSASVTVTAGAGNRKLIVGFAMESNASVTSLTFNGQEIVGLVIDLTDISTQSVSRCVMFEQFESGLPASGSHTLAATLSGAATGGGRMFYWLVDGVEQGELAEGASGQVANGGTSGATFQTDETFAAGLDGRALFSVAYRNDDVTSLLLTTPSGATLQSDTDLSGLGGGRVSGSSKVGGMGTGTVRPTWTTQASGQSRRTGAACMLNPVTTATVDAAGAVEVGAVTVAGTATVVSPAELEASGDIEIVSVALDGLLTLLSPASGAISVGAVTVAGAATVEPPPPIEAAGAVEVGGVTVAGTATVTESPPKTADGAVEVGAVTVAGTATLDAADDRAAAGVVTVGSLEVAGTATVEPPAPREASGDIEVVSVSLAGLLTLLSPASGAIAVGAVEVAGTATVAPLIAPGIPGSVLIRDRAFGGASVSDAAFGSILISDRALGAP